MTQYQIENMEEKGNKMITIEKVIEIIESELCVVIHEIEQHFYWASWNDEVYINHVGWGFNVSFSNETYVNQKEKNQITMRLFNLDNESDLIRFIKRYKIIKVQL